MEGEAAAQTPIVLGSAGVCCLALALLRTYVVDRHPFGQPLIALLRRVEVLSLAGLLGLMIVFSALQIILRNLADTGLLWVDPFLRYLTLWIGFLGAAHATAAGRHIQIDILARISPPPVRRVAARVVSLAAAVVALVLAETAYRHVLDERDFGATGFLDIPTWILLAVMPFAFGLMCYRFAYRALAPPAERAGSPAGDSGSERGGARGPEAAW